MPPDPDPVPDVEFDIVDVFTDRPFAGNQLAVVHGAEELDDDQLQQLTVEFGFSETTFPSRASDTGYDVRIFTPEREIPFAGHPTLGTAWVLRARGALGADRVVQTCAAGAVEVRFEGSRVELSATPQELVGPLADDLVASLLADLGLEVSDLAGDVYLAGAGLSFVHLPVRAPAVAQARPVGRFEALSTAAGLSAGGDLLDAVNLHAVSGSAPELTVRSRVFVPGGGVAEDPATGSAAAGLGIALVARGLLPDGGSYEITQGVEMGRPSRLSCRVDAADGAATRCHVAGSVQPVASGRIAVPGRRLVPTAPE